MRALYSDTHQVAEGAGAAPLALSYSITGSGRYESFDSIGPSGTKRTFGGWFLRTGWRMLWNSNEILWYSQRDDWGQLYLYDLTTGDFDFAYRRHYDTPYIDHMRAPVD